MNFRSIVAVFVRRGPEVTALRLIFMEDASVDYWEGEE